jgi:hypothetical protein
MTDGVVKQVSKLHPMYAEIEEMETILASFVQ